MFTEGAVEFKKGTCWWCFHKEEFNKAGQHILKKVLSDHKWAAESNKIIREKGKALLAFAEKIKNLNLSGMSNAELADTYEKFNGVLTEAQQPGLPSFILEYHELLTRHLTDYLKATIEEKKLEFNASEALVLLTTPSEETVVKKSEHAMLALALEASRNRSFIEAVKKSAGDEEATVDEFPEVKALLDELHSKFSWISYIYEGPAKPRKAFAQELVWIVAAENAGEILRDEENKSKLLKARQKELLRKLDVDEGNRFLLEYAKEIVFLKGFRKDCIYQAFYCAEPLFKEIALRLSVSIEQLHAFPPREIIECLRGKTLDATRVGEMHEHNVLHVTSDDCRVLVRDEAKRFAEELHAHVSVRDIAEFKGTCACLGKAVGRVKIVATQHDIAKVEQGDILVSPTTNPDLVPAMKKAAAIVSDQGGLTCHAAIVSRELGVPCMVGARNASKILRDGDFVEVDATNGVVSKVKWWYWKAVLRKG